MPTKDAGKRRPLTVRQVAAARMLVMYPDKTKKSIMEEMKNDPALSSIPVVVFSVSATPRHQNRALLMGASGYLSKPVDASRLRQAIAATIHWDGMVATSRPESATTTS